MRINTAFLVVLVRHVCDQVGGSFPRVGLRFHAGYDAYSHVLSRPTIDDFCVKNRAKRNQFFLAVDL
jgi:hypothetical protein